MAGKTTQERTSYATAVAMATLSIAILAALTHPLTAQEVVALPGEDRPLDADSEDIYHVGRELGDRAVFNTCQGGLLCAADAADAANLPRGAPPHQDI